MNRGKRLRNSIVTPEQALLEALGHPQTAATDVPSAQCTFIDDTGEEVYPVTRVDPVHVRAEPDHARLHAADAIALKPAESDLLISTLNDQFRDRGLVFTAGDQNRWYLTGMSGADLRTEPLARVADRNLVGFINANEHPQHWRQLLTEIQMLLHEHPVNTKRMEQGLLPVNSLWCWGGHALQAVPLPTAARVYADDAFSRGLARLSAFKTFPVVEAKARLGSCSQIVCVRSLESGLLRQVGENDFPDSLDSTSLVANAGTTDKHSLSEEGRQIEQLDNLLRLAQSALLKGWLTAVTLIPCNGTAYRLTRRDLIRFWSTPWSRRESAAPVTMQ